MWIDLNKIRIPSYFVSTKEDHIALWQGTYRGALQVGGNKTFVLGESGHIAGIVNHPAKEKYGFWTNSTLEESADDWMNNAEHQKGSWWIHWDQWLSQFNADEKVAPYPVGNDAFPVLCDAPGQYVLQTLPVESSKPNPDDNHSRVEVSEST